MSSFSGIYQVVPKAFPNNYSSHMSTYIPFVKDSDSNNKNPEVNLHREDTRAQVKTKPPIQPDDPMVNFRLKLLKVYRKMTRSDIYYFHHQMKKYFPYLTDDVQEPVALFSLLIKHGLIGPSNTQILVESFFALKRHELISLLTDNQYTPYKPTVPTYDRDILTDQFVLRFCTDDIGPDELWQLGVKGFKLPFIVIQRAQYDSKSTLDATLTVFTQWKQQAPNADISEISTADMPPYSRKGLSRALKDAQLNFVLHKYFV